MKKEIIPLIIAASAFNANAVVLKFDDMQGVMQDSFDPIYKYKGFEFSSIDQWAMNQLYWFDTVDSPWDQGAVSGDFTLVNSYGGPGIVKAVDHSSFSFDGLWIKYWDNSLTDTAYVRGYNNGSLVWTKSFTLEPNFQYINGMNGAIDELQIVYDGMFIVDNLALNEPGASAVPEPTSFALVGLGLTGLGIARRRKKDC